MNTYICEYVMYEFSMRNDQFVTKVAFFSPKKFVRKFNKLMYMGFKSFVSNCIWTISIKIVVEIPSSPKIFNGYSNWVIVLNSKKITINIFLEKLFMKHNSHHWASKVESCKKSKKITWQKVASQMCSCNFLDGVIRYKSTQLPLDSHQW